MTDRKVMDPDNSTSAILIQATTGRRKDSTPVEVLAGTLLSFVGEKEAKSKTDLVFDVLDAEKPIRVACKVSEFRSISPLIKDLLRPIPTCGERLEVYNDSEWLSDGSELRVGDTVFVKLKREHRELPGVLKFKGSEVPDSKGIIFGVELKVKKGTSDGSFRRMRIFTTEQDYAVFVSLNKIRKNRDGCHKTRSRVDENCTAQQTIVQCNLQLSERVVWMTDEGPEKATVQWIGRLPDEPGDNITVGVAFDNPVGTGTGKYKDKRLFYTKQGHASLIPLTNIMKEEDFEHPGSPDIIDEASQEVIRQQTIMLDQITLNRDQGTLQRSPGPNQMEAVVRCSLQLGERVVWMTDEGPEKATVQWIGRLPDEPGDNITVGVAFDNPVGTGTGKYKDKRLFYTKQGHASLIPLICLMKEEDFEHPDNQNCYEEGESATSGPKIGDLSQVAMETWTVDDVCTWLISLDLAEYTANFRAHAIDGKELLTLTDSDLMSALAVGPFGHRKKILRERTAVQQTVVSGKRTEQNSIPNEFLCPITLELMKDPVIASDGYTYDRQAIESWITKEHRSPMTNVLLTSTEVTPNRTLKMMMHNFLDSA
ncbi:hypothetical protein BsWGS_25734 [Bradybaena similaris]